MQMLRRCLVPPELGYSNRAGRGEYVPRAVRDALLCVLLVGADCFDVYCFGAELAR
jgi:hypothetical protein